MALHVQESYVNATEGHRYGETDVYETGHDVIGDLYRAMQQEYGRCIGKVHVDGLAGTVGWVFVARVTYDDSTDTYLRETWVTVHDEKPTVTVEKHYHEIGAAA